MSEHPVRHPEVHDPAPGDPASPRRGHRRGLRVALGLAGSGVFLALLLGRSDAAEVWDAAAAARPGWIAAAAAVYGAALWLRASRWRALAGAAVPLGRGAALRLVVAGYALNNVLPVRAGEVARAELAHRRTGAGRWLVLGTILAERILDAAVLALLLAATLATAGGDGRLRLLAAASLVAAGGGLALLLALARAAGAERDPRGGLVRRALDRLPGVVAGWVRHVLAGMGTLRTRGAWARTGALTCASWLVEAAMYALVGEALGLDLHWPLYLAVAGAANLAIAVPSSAGGIGPFEFFARETAVHFGADPAAATAYALVLHATLLVPVALAGLPLLWAEARRPRRRAEPVTAAATAEGEGTSCA